MEHRSSASWLGEKSPFRSGQPVLSTRSVGFVFTNSTCTCPSLRRWRAGLCWCADLCWCRPCQSRSSAAGQRWRRPTVWSLRSPHNRLGQGGTYKGARGEMHMKPRAVERGPGVEQPAVRCAYDRCGAAIRPAGHAAAQPPALAGRPRAEAAWPMPGRRAALACRARQDGLVPGKFGHAGQPAIRLHEVDGHPGQALVKSGLERLDVAALRERRWHEFVSPVCVFLFGVSGSA